MKEHSQPEGSENIIVRIKKSLTMKLDLNSGSELNRIGFISLLLLSSFILTYYFHLQGIGHVFTHFFYLPTIMACIWWRRKGLLVPSILAILLIISNLMIPFSGVNLTEDLLRGVMFILVGLVTVLLTERFQETERQLSTLMSNLPGMAYRCKNDEDWTMKFVSEGCYELTGYTSKELVKNKKISYSSTIHPDDVEKVWNVVQLGVSSQKPFKTTYRIITADSKEKYVWEQGCGIYSDKRELISLEGFITDITNRKKVEQEVKHLNSVLKSIRNVNQLIVKEKNRDELFRRVCNILRKTRDFKFVWIGLVNEENFDIVPAASSGFEEGYLDSIEITWDDSPEGNGPSGMAIKNRKPHIMRNLIHDPNFKPWKDEALKRGFSSSIALPLMHEKMVYGSLAIYSEEFDAFNSEEAVLLMELAEDIGFAIHNLNVESKQREMEESLRTSEEKYRTLFDNADDAIIIMKDNRFVDCNSKTLDMYGASRGEIIGETPHTLFSPHHQDKKSREKALKYINRALDGIPQVFEWELRKKDGALFYGEVKLNNLNLEGGNYLMAVVRDITERKIAEDQIKLSLHEKEVLLREIHHRVKNNLQIISSLLNLQSRGIDNEEVREIFKESQTRVKAMAMVHEKLYQSNDLSKIQFKDYILSLVVNLIQTYLKDPSIIALKTDIDEIYVDINTAVPSGLIITEIISNSLKHAFPEEGAGEINIFLRREGSDLVLKISDNGKGFPGDFDFRNTGTLGLQLVNSLVEQLEGKIELDNTNGVEFRIIFKELEYAKRN
ncbi:Histidine kinase [anaerobic digester metagenome]